MAFGLNQVNFIGRLGNDAEIVELKNDKKMAKLSIAVDDSYMDKETGERVERAYWFNCVTFNHNFAESIEKYAKKGRLVVINGKAKTSSFEDKDGNKRTSIEFVINEISYLDKGDKSEEPA